MRLLLTSAGIRNPSLHAALLDLLGKPIEECNALAITTGSYAQSRGPFLAWNFLSGQRTETPMVELGWKSVGVLELTALPSLDESRWRPALEAADVLLVNGGDPLFLGHWMRESGVARVLSSLENLVYVGLSAGSMIMTPKIGEYFVGWRQPSGDDTTLGVVDFSIFPHMDHPALPHNTMADAEREAPRMNHTVYAIDDETGIKVVDGQIEVISEGVWRLFTSS
jgi:dipeptidase E